MGFNFIPPLPLTKDNYSKALLQRLEQGRGEWNDLNNEQREIQKRRHESGLTPVEFANGTYVLKNRASKEQPKLVTKWLDRMLGAYKVDGASEANG